MRTEGASKKLVSMTIPFFQSMHPAGKLYLGEMSSQLLLFESGFILIPGSNLEQLNDKLQ